MMKTKDSKKAAWKHVQAGHRQRGRRSTRPLGVFGTLAAVSVVASGLLLLAGCHTSLPDPKLTVWNDLLILAPQAETPTSGPYLTVDDIDVNSTSHYSRSGQVLDGALRSASELSHGARGPPMDFTSKTPTSRPFYLNVSAPILVSMYVTNSLHFATPPTAEAPRVSADAGKIRVSIFVNETLLGGGEAEISAAMATTDEFFRAWFTFRPELHTIPAGATLKFRVHQISGLADLVVGTGGNTQSLVSIPHFPFDPLATAVYLDRNTMVMTPPGEESETEFFERAQAALAAYPRDAANRPSVIVLPPRGSHHHDEVPPELIGLSVAPGFVAFTGRMIRRRARETRSIGILLVLAATALAGCTSAPGSVFSLDDKETGAETTAPVTEMLVKDKTLAERKIGAVEGKVRDEYGRIVTGAHVSFLGTNLFGSSDDQGRFRFREIAPGRYMLRIDAKGYDSVQSTVNVTAGSSTILVVTLKLPEYVKGNTRPHQHDDWGGEVRKQVQDILDFAPKTCVADACQDVGGVTSTWVCDDHQSYCESQVPLDFKGRILPGAGAVEVVVDWAKGPRTIQEIGISYASPGAKEPAKNAYMPRGPREPFFISVFPNEADPGHQQFTNWVLYVRASRTDLYAPWSSPLKSSPPLHVSVFVHKGVIPFEPPHNASALWANRQSLEVVSGARVAFSAVLGDLPNKDVKIGTDPSSFVLAGTKEIRGKLSWTIKVEGRDNLVPPPEALRPAFELSYKPASVPAGEWQDNLKAVTISERKENSFKFSITPLGTEVDQFYQLQSYWEFFPTDPYESIAGTTYGRDTYGTVTFVLDAEILKDSDFEGT